MLVFTLISMCGYFVRFHQESNPDFSSKPEELNIMLWNQAFVENRTQITTIQCRGNNHHKKWEMRPEIWRFSVFESEVADSYFGCSFSVSPLSVFILVNQIVLISSKWTLTSPLKDTTYFYSSCENIKDLWLCRCSLLLFSTSQNLSRLQYLLLSVSEH